MVRPSANQQVQISCGQMLVPQSRQSNIRRERVVPKNVRSFTTQFFQIEATRSVLEWRETKEPSFRIRGHEHRSDSFLGLRLGWRRTSRARGTSLVESVHKKTEDHRQKQCSSIRSIRSVRSERGPEHGVCLGFCSEASVEHGRKSNGAHSPSTWNRQNETHRRGAFVAAR